MTHLTQGDIAFDVGQWPFKAGQPTIFFIHGSGNSRLLWKKQLEALTDCANTVALDLPGHGASAGAGMDSVDDYAQAVEKLIDTLQAPQPIPCGLSLGGAIVLQLLLNRKGRYAAGIVINSGARLRVLPHIFEMIKNDYPTYAKLLPSVAASQQTDPNLLTEVVDDTLACPPEVAFKDFTACNTFDVMGRLESLGDKILVLSAEEDQLTPPKYGQYLGATLANAKMVRIARAGHLSPIEQPRAVNRAIRDFLKEFVYKEVAK